MLTNCKYVVVSEAITMTVNVMAVHINRVFGAAGFFKPFIVIFIFEKCNFRLLLNRKKLSLFTGVSLS